MYKKPKIFDELERVAPLIPIPVYWLDTKYIIMGGNDVCLEAIGSNAATFKEALVGKTFYDYYSKEIADELTKMIKVVLETNKATKAEEKIADVTTGKFRYYETVRAPLFGDDGKMVGTICTAIETTDKKEAEEYRIRHEAAEKLTRFTNLVAGSIAHELKTPLAGIKSQMDYLEGLIDSDKMTQQEKDTFLHGMTTHVQKVIKATTHVIEDMLLKIRTFATGKVHHGAFEKNSIILDVEIFLNAFPFVTNQQELVTVLYTGRFNYLGDRILTNHVLANLMKNALHAIKETDKENVSITIETKIDKDYNLLIFRDTATGIPKDFVDKIFDQFETKKDTHGGTGLGLAFCKMVMEECYNGKITCNSEEGRYTEFVLSFPKINL